mmetsp:Transcript_3550/g.10081  ORF Transcript_3550/g.10081 Transcript_3550/m.10081 type:complete len:201 (-) Transcript_3550:882-1484(-)
MCAHAPPLPTCCPLQCSLTLPGSDSGVESTVCVPWPFCCSRQARRQRISRDWCPGRTQPPRPRPSVCWWRPTLERQPPKRGRAWSPPSIEAVTPRNFRRRCLRFWPPCAARRRRREPLESRVTGHFRHPRWSASERKRPRVREALLLLERERTCQATSGVLRGRLRLRSRIGGATAASLAVRQLKVQVRSDMEEALAKCR